MSLMPRASFTVLRGSTLQILRTTWSLNTLYLHKAKLTTLSQITRRPPATTYQSYVSQISDSHKARGACSIIYNHGRHLSSAIPARPVPGSESVTFPALRKIGLKKVSSLRKSRCSTSLCIQTFRPFSSQSDRDQVLTALKMKKVLVIGISGITNGGKTTLCERLERDLPMATHINMDDYFFKPESGHIPLVEELNHGNYEDVRAIDFANMVKDVDKWVTEAADKPVNDHPQILFLEGILILNYPPLEKYYSLKYFLTLTKEQCWERRKHRLYDPPDPPKYYDVVVWPMYLRNKADIQDQKDIVYLDGMDCLNKTYRRILADIKALLED